jgi:predicted nuclease with RNAse H fold
VLIAGLDLAAQPKGTALAVLHCTDQVVSLVNLVHAATDSEIIQATLDCEKFGIDCALGWPISFVDFVSSYSQTSLVGAKFDGGIDWRRDLAYRETDREVHRITGRWPLSVSTDRLGMTAMRCAGLLSKLESSGFAVDRSGMGKVVEIYPAASLRIWGFSIAGYRNSTKIREKLLRELGVAAPWLRLGEYSNELIASCDAFDSVVAAIATLSAVLGKSTKPPLEKLELAQIEGWVALPRGPLTELLS